MSALYFHESIKIELFPVIGNDVAYGFLNTVYCYIFCFYFSQYNNY